MLAKLQQLVKKSKAVKCPVIEGAETWLKEYYEFEILDMLYEQAKKGRETFPINIVSFRVLSRDKKPSLEETLKCGEVTHTLQYIYNSGNNDLDKWVKACYAIRNKLASAETKQAFIVKQARVLSDFFTQAFECWKQVESTLDACFERRQRLVTKWHDGKATYEIIYGIEVSWKQALEREKKRQCVLDISQ